MKRHYLISAIVSMAMLAGVLSCNKRVTVGTPDPDNVSFFTKNSANFSFVPISLARRIASRRPADSADIYLTGNDSSRIPRQIESEYTYFGKDGIADFYAFNYSGGGFILIAADLKTNPVLAHANKGRWGKSSFPANLQYWLNGTKGYVDFVRNKQDTVRDNLFQLWSHLLPDQQLRVSTVATIQGKKTGTSTPPDQCTPTETYQYVGPLMATTWGQGCGYNDLCPADPAGKCDHDLTGCVATALAQVAYYYRFPARYAYGNMPLMPVTGVNYPDMATLMADIGGFVQMQYGPTFSGANGGNILPALTNNLGFNAAATGINYDGAAPAVIENNINSAQVVLLLAHDTNTGEGHVWVCDGYETYAYLNGQCVASVGLADYHMNWGFGEIGLDNYIGWYDISLWDADGYEFGVNRQVIVNLHP